MIENVLKIVAFGIGHFSPFCDWVPDGCCSNEPSRLKGIETEEETHNTTNATSSNEPSRLKGIETFLSV